jgi:hypothetical protein
MPRTNAQPNAAPARPHATIHLPIAARDDLEELRKQLARERCVHVPIGNAVVYAIQTALAVRKARQSK